MSIGCISEVQRDTKGLPAANPINFKFQFKEKKKHIASRMNQNILNDWKKF